MPKQIVFSFYISIQIEQDFEILHPAAANNLYCKWSTVSEDLLRYCPKAYPSWQSLILEEDIELKDLTAGTYPKVHFTNDLQLICENCFGQKSHNAKVWMA